jgi:hypothetical protein
MKVFHSKDSLRLAARTLIEWRTPKKSSAFVEVLHDILVDHPIAAQLGIKRGHELFALDDQGVLLWFLSETMDAPIPSRAVPETNIAKQMASLLDNQIYHDGAVGYGDSELWQHGPLKSQVVDAVLVGLVKNDLQSSMALLAITIPLPLWIQRKHVGLTKSQYKVNWRILERLSARLTSLAVATKGLSRLSAIFSVVIAVVSGAIVVTDSNFKVSHAPFNTELLGVLLLTGILALSERIVSGTVFRRLVMSVWMSAPKMSSVGLAKIMLRDNRLKSPMFKQVSRHFDQMCATESGVFQFILEQHQETVWADAALSANTPLSKRIKRELILLLRSPELSEWSKFRLLSRLCD